MKLSDLKTLSKPVWFLLVGSVFSSASYFISMPYLALRLKTALELNPLVIGLTLGVGPLFGILGGFYTGYLSDHWGRKAMILISVFLWGFMFFGFAFATQIWEFAFLNMINGLCNATYKPLIAAMVSDLTPAVHRKTAFHLRYYAINVGAAIGPVFGAWLLIRNPVSGFLIAAAVYFVYGVASIFQLPNDSKKPVSTVVKDSFVATLKVLSLDKPLLYFTLASVLISLAYCQLESTLPQFLQSTSGQEGVKTFGILMAINGFTVVFFQFPLNRLASKLSLIGTLKMGSFIYGIGMMFFGLVHHSRALLILSMFVLTLGEILVFSNGNLIIDQIAPEDKKGAYFGASALWAIGPTLGPALGGIILMHWGGTIVFVLAGIIGVANVLVYHLGYLAQGQISSAKNLPLLQNT